MTEVFQVSGPHFVTGATGFIGGHLVNRLIERGDEVTALVRTPYQARHLADMGVRVMQGDITDAAAVRRAMAGCGSVFHVAAMYKMGVTDPAAMEAANIDGTRIVLEAMRDLDIPRGVYTSSVAVHSDTEGEIVDESNRFEGEHLTHYDRTKWEAHYNVAVPMMEEGLPLVVVQPGVVYGPGDHSSIASMFEDFLKGRLPAVPGESQYAWAHVEDVVFGHIAALERGRPGECYHLAGPIHTFREVFDVAARLTRRRPPRFEIPPGLMHALVPVASLLERLAAVPDTFKSEALRASAGVTYVASSRKAERELNFSARPIEDGLKDTLVDIAGRTTSSKRRTRK